jgi:hypothetical protein
MSQNGSAAVRARRERKPRAVQAPKRRDGESPEARNPMVLDPSAISNDPAPPDAKDQPENNGGPKLMTKIMMQWFVAELGENGKLGEPGPWGTQLPNGAQVPVTREFSTYEHAGEFLKDLEKQFPPAARSALPSEAA